MNFIDTGILLYAISKDPAEVEKSRQARLILNDPSITLSVQVLQEFYVQATRPTRSDPLTHQEACALIQHWLRHRVVPVTVQVLRDALEIKNRCQTSYWDAAILAAAASAGCTRVLSEDLNPGQNYHGIRIHNPFERQKEEGRGGKA
jgi:predicted nucleic acid-binding protein